MSRVIAWVAVGLMTGVALGGESFTFASWNIGHYALGNDGCFKTAPAGDCYLSLDNIIVKGLEIADFKAWDCPDLSDHALVSAKLMLNNGAR